ncbi:hypothetical protein [Jeotgalibaca sp. A127]|uniref:hypothetical protein n=1 Tax=Jeotgalibaca sp. A127 TaxID=3457324 RepID=UPI003FCF896F
MPTHRAVWFQGEKGWLLVANPEVLLTYMRMLDDKHGASWGLLPDDHPDIETARVLNPQSVKPAERRGWTEEEEQFIRDNYETMTDKQMALELKRGKSTVETQRRAMGLVKRVGEASSVIYTQEDGTELLFETISDARAFSGITKWYMKKELEKEGGRYRYAEPLTLHDA